MAYEIGTATSTFDLLDKLATFMSSVSGWTLWSNIGPYDKVYRSAGSNGKNEIFIRQRLGPVETFLRGADQHDYGNGDTGFLNFQAYVSFPQDGDAYAGASEIGQFGPRRFFTGAYTNHTYHQDMLSDKPGGAPHVLYGEPEQELSPDPGTTDTNCRARRRWKIQRNHPNAGSAYYNDNKPMATDAHRYFYFFDIAAGNSALRRYSLRRLGGHYNDDGTTDYYYQLPVLSSFQSTQGVYVEDRTTRRPWLYFSSTSTYNGIKRLNLLNHSVQNIYGITWPDRGGGIYGMGCNALWAWNGDRYIYILRSGGGTVGDESGDWGRLDILTHQWKSTTDPENPVFRSIPSTPTDYRFNGAPNSMAFLDKRISGFQYDRLYVAHGGTKYMLYLELGEDGLPHTGNPYWTPQGHSTTSGQYYWTGGVLFNRTGRMFHNSYYAQGQANGIYERFPHTPGRPMLYADLKEYGDIDWQASSLCYFPEYSTVAPNTEFTDGYACRVRTSIGSDTDYIFIADEDRVIIATKSNALLDPAYSDNVCDWSVAYMGAIDSNYDDTPYGEFADDIKAGFSKKVRLVNREGTFEEGGKYFVIDTTGASYDFYHHIWKKTFRFASSETVVVEKVENDVVTLSLKHDYSAGSKLARDPQPVGLFLWELEKVQMTSISNSAYDDPGGSDDPSAQIHSCPMPEGEITTSAAGAMETNTSLQLWEYIISTTEGECLYSNQENRGTLRGVYGLGKASGISAGETISVGDDTYYIIEPPDYNKFLVIGPLK